MFFFFVGSLEQQPGRVIESSAGRCIRCGWYADLVEYEKVLKLFFVPVWRWPGKDHAFYCRDCSLLFSHSLPVNGDNGGGLLDEDNQSVPSLAQVLRCQSCERVVEPQFRFCPFCGSAL